MRATEAARYGEFQDKVTAQLQKDISSKLAAAMSVQMQAEKEQFEKNLQAKYASDYDEYLVQVRAEAMRQASKEAAASIEAAEKEASRQTAAQQKAYNEVMSVGEQESARRVLEKEKVIRK